MQSQLNRASRSLSINVQRPRAAVSRRPVQCQAFFNFGGAKEETGGKKTFYDFEVKDIDNRGTKMNKYKGKVVLVVNLASQCGFTPQYEELSELYTKFNKKGLAIAGFPEPGSNSEIKRFAQSNYGAKFDLFSKVDVNGASAAPLFEWLKKEKGELFGDDVKWNFSKFLLDKEGKVVGRYPSTTSPAAIQKDIERLL
ncbi:MAG: hypothetical protein WDW38_000676 [Sanguina aurantia]